MPGLKPIFMHVLVSRDEVGVIDANPLAERDRCVKALEAGGSDPSLWTRLILACVAARDIRKCAETSVKAEKESGGEASSRAKHVLFWRAVRAACLYMLGERAEAAELAKSTGEEAEAAGVAEAVAFSLLVRGNHEQVHGNSTEAEKQLEEAKRLFARLGHRRQWCAAAINQLISVGNRGEPLEVVRRGMELLHDPLVRENAYLGAPLATHLADAYERLGEIGESIKHRSECLRLSETMPGSPGVAISCLNIAHSRCLAGEYPEAREILTKLYRLSENVDAGVVTAARVLEAEVALSAGDVEEAGSILATVNPRTDPDCRNRTEVEYLRVRAHLHAATQEWEKALETGLEGLRRANQFGIKGMRGSLLERIGDTFAACPSLSAPVRRKVVAALREMFPESGAGDTKDGLSVWVYGIAFENSASDGDDALVRIRRKRAAALAKTGRNGEAYAELERSFREADSVARRANARTRSVLQLKFAADLQRVEYEQTLRTNERLREEVERRKKSEAELRRLDAEKSALMRVVAHDLRSPAAAIRSIVDIMEDPETEPDSAREWLKEIRRTSSEMIELVGDLLDLDRASSGDATSDLMTVELRGIIDKVVHAGKPHATRKNIVIERTTASAPVKAAPAELFRCARNLLSNALKYSPPGSRVWLRVEEADGEQPALVVEDEGPGVREDEIPKLFRPFERLSARPTADETSSGIGLSIVKRLMEKMGGDVFFRPREGGGAAFGLRLPRA